MFKSLRRKFITTAVLSVTVVIVLMAGTLNFINYYKIGQRVDATLYEAANSSTLTAVFSEDGDDLVITKNASSATTYNGFSVVKVNSEGKVIRSYRDDSLLENHESVQKLTNAAVERPYNNGYVGSYRFLKVKTSVGDLILFLNIQRELDSYHSFVRNTVIISTIVILSVFVLIVLMSKKVILPIQQGYQKQKQFITDASHELKTPLAIIRSNTDVLELENGDSKWTKNIQNQVDRLTSLVNSLVVFSRMEEKDNVEKIKFNLSECLKTRIEDFEELANFQKKHFITDIDNDVHYSGEQQAIVQLMDILLENSIKYAPKDTQINVSLKKNRRHATLKVSNVANVKKGDLRKVFDRFYRLDESRNSNIKGYGIGLSMAQVIAEKHKETIKAYAPEDGIFKIEVRFTLDEHK
ncbi:ATPase/histidine kinase/DNA gyrase B/HSP90 domain protein [Gemella bergeri ATCC 700627]|uniref:histidine kinase n=1 Tax=Gemella bergeri ATCC 700627 TaxID=1321820 RepID=U2QKA0_9BACL|nr:HAMP domain-containing sensor histidine kinase [Gemella bergeri]ERK56906.1 ATPase/histidine kinase/DNA gyrase B/HSP90 domain protein [Gemella bergeri ATCC 700627]